MVLDLERKAVPFAATPPPSLPPPAPPPLPANGTANGTASNVTTARGPPPLQPLVHAAGFVVSGVKLRNAPGGWEALLDVRDRVRTLRLYLGCSGDRPAAGLAAHAANPYLPRPRPAVPGGKAVSAHDALAGDADW